MQPADLLTRFQAAAAAGKVDGSTAPGMSDLLATLGRTELDFSGGAAGLQGDSAWLTGTANFLARSWPLRLTGRDAGDPSHPEWSRFLMHLTPPVTNGTSTIANAFGELPQS